MEAYVGMFSAWVNSFGVPPMGIAIMLGIITFYMLSGRRAISLTSAGRIIPQPGVALARIDRTVDYEGRSVAIPGAALAYIDAGDRIQAIKALRDGTDLELVDAKRIVDALARQRGHDD